MHFQHPGQDDLLHYLDGAGTPAGMDPANLSHSNSPTDAYSSDNIFLEGLEIYLGESSGQPFIDDLGATLPSAEMSQENLSHSNSPTDTSSSNDNFPPDGFGSYYDQGSGPSFGDDLGILWPQTDSENIFINGSQEHHQPNGKAFNNEVSPEEGERIIVIAQPKAKYRERYSSELDPLRNRAQRFIRTEEDNKKYEYPTIRVSPL